MLSKPLNKGDFCETHVVYRLALIHSIAVQSDNLSSINHENTPNAPHRFKNVIFRHHYVPCRKTAIVLKLSKWAKLSLRSSLLQSPSC